MIIEYNKLIISYLNEPMLFQCFEIIYNYLDNNSNGYCLICSESLKLSSTSSLVTSATSKLISINNCNNNNKNINNNNTKQCQYFALRTECFHCYHFHCIIKWAALSIMSQKVNKSGRQLRDKKNRNFKFQ